MTSYLKDLELPHLLVQPVPDERGRLIEGLELVLGPVQPAGQVVEGVLDPLGLGQGGLQVVGPVEGGVEDVDDLG